MPRSTSRRAAALVSALALGAGALTAATPATAAPDADSRAVVRGLLSPLSVAVSPRGAAYVSQNFAGQLMLKRPGRRMREVYTARGRGTEVGAVSLRRRSVVFATTQGDGDTFLHRLGRDGRARKLANLGRHERRHNPDEGVMYGARGVSDECAAQFPEQVPALYPGIVESHPYATHQTRRTTYVADAAANAVLGVDRRGRVSTVAVLPGAPLEITGELAGMFGIPECAVGLDYWFESVPTDVEKGPDGKLYVSSLPGGPEDPSLGARGSIWRVNPRTGAVSQVAADLLSPTGIAVANDGTIYVAELFAGRVSRLRPGASTAVPWASPVLPGDVEVARGKVYATTHVLSGLSGEEGDVPDGRLIRRRR